MDAQHYNLKRKANQYKDVLRNTTSYREVWKVELKAYIIDQLEKLLQIAEVDAKIATKSEVEGLEAIVLSLGDVRSGLYEKVNDNLQRHLIKHNGSLIYQQLFNGKVIVLINYPFIENYGKPRPPKTIAIYRPEELKEPFFIRHLEELLQEITNWEDYDDDEPNKKIGFQLNFNQEQQA